MQQEREQYLNAVQESENQIAQAINSSTPPIIDEECEPSSQQVANAKVAMDPVMIEVLRLLKDISHNNNKRK